MKTMKSEYQSPRVDIMNMIPEAGLLQAGSAQSGIISYGGNASGAGD